MPDEGYAEALAAVLRFLQRSRVCSGSLCRFPEQNISQFHVPIVGTCHRVDELIFLPAALPDEIRVNPKSKFVVVTGRINASPRTSFAFLYIVSHESPELLEQHCYESRAPVQSCL